MAAVYTCTYRVSYADCTMGDHVYYSRYLDFLERGRGEFFRHLGPTCLDLQRQDTLFPVIEAKVRYKAPARYDELLTIEMQVITAVGPRLGFAYRILQAGGEVKIEAETQHICTTATNKPKRLPKDLLARLQPYLPAPSPNSQTTGAV